MIMLVIIVLEQRKKHFAQLNEDTTFYTTNLCVRIFFMAAGTKIDTRMELAIVGYGLMD